MLDYSNIKLHSFLFQLQWLSSNNNIKSSQLSKQQMTDTNRIYDDIHCDLGFQYMT